MAKITKRVFDKIPPNTTFQTGLILNGLSDEDVFASTIRVEEFLRYVAHKGSGNDFTIYVSFADKTESDVLLYGDKLSISASKKMINADDEVWKCFRC